MSDKEFSVIYGKHKHGLGVLKNIMEVYESTIVPHAELVLCTHHNLLKLLSYFLRCKIYFALKVEEREIKKSVIKKKFVKNSV